MIWGAAKSHLALPGGGLVCNVQSWPSSTFLLVGSVALVSCSIHARLVFSACEMGSVVPPASEAVGWGKRDGVVVPQHGVVVLPGARSVQTPSWSQLCSVQRTCTHTVPSECEKSRARLPPPPGPASASPGLRVGARALHRCFSLSRCFMGLLGLGSDGVGWPATWTGPDV